MKICISAESTIDLSKELLAQYEIEIIPFGVLLGEDAYLDGRYGAVPLFDSIYTPFDSESKEW